MVRRTVMKYLRRAFTGPDAERCIASFRVMSQVMAEADRRGPGRFATAMSA
ncbi:hypothetical protein D516_2687 [Rhodobacter sp. AKP1]|nr:hypothetical protein D516_2687 [Rhodobacter sp. AKP1]